MTVTEPPATLIERAAVEVETWPESYAEPLADWLRIAAAEAGRSCHGARPDHPVIAVAREIVADAARPSAPPRRFH